MILKELEILAWETKYENADILQSDLMFYLTLIDFM